MDYPMINPDIIKRVIGSKVFVEWEEAKEDLLGGLLVRPDPQRARHYTGVILKVGPDADPVLVEGQRVFFEQFSDFEKFQSPDGKRRFAFLRDTDCYAVIPERAKVRCGDWTEYGDGTE